VLARAGQRSAVRLPVAAPVPVHRGGVTITVEERVGWPRIVLRHRPRQPSCRRWSTFCRRAPSAEICLLAAIVASAGLALGFGE